MPEHKETQPERVSITAVKVYRSQDGWCVETDGDMRVYVYHTKRSALNKVEAVLDECYPNG